MVFTPEYPSSPSTSKNSSRPSNPLVTASRQDEGNVSYDFGAVSDTDFAFIERWESQELLEKHMGTEHFQKAVAAWEPLLSSELDVRIVNFR